MEQTKLDQLRALIAAQKLTQDLQLADATLDIARAAYEIMKVL